MELPSLPTLNNVSGCLVFAYSQTLTLLAIRSRDSNIADISHFYIVTFRKWLVSKWQENGKLSCSLEIRLRLPAMQTLGCQLGKGSVELLLEAWLDMALVRRNQGANLTLFQSTCIPS